MQQPDSLNQVAEFHRTFHAPVLDYLQKRGKIKHLLS